MSYHYLLDVFGCSSVQLDDEYFLIDLIENAAISCGAEVIQTISHKFTPQGVTAISLLSESHISVHTWPEKKEAAFDIYTCGEAVPKIAVDIILEQLKPTSYTLNFMERLV